MRTIGSFPRENFKAFDAAELAGVGGYEGGPETAGLGGDEEIQRTDGRAGRFQGRADIAVMPGGVEGEIRNPKEAQKGFEKTGLMRMRPEVFLHAGPEFGGDDDRDSGESRIRHLLEA